MLSHDTRHVTICGRYVTNNIHIGFIFFIYSVANDVSADWHNGVRHDT